MYKNIGEKIKGLAIALFIIQAVGSVIAGIILIVEGTGLEIAGFLTLLLGPLFAWVLSWVLYGFGQLIENSDKTAESTKRIFNILQTESSESRPSLIIQKDHSQPDKKNNTQPDKIDNEHWRCGKCGKTNLSSNDKCWSCGN